MNIPTRYLVLLFVVAASYLNLLNASQSVEDSVNAYPVPPWQRTVLASGFGLNRSIASFECQSDARFRVRYLERVCRNNQGMTSSGYPFCSLCNMFGNQWRCTDTLLVKCRAVEDEFELDSLEQ